MRTELLLPGAAEPAEAAAPSGIDEAGAESRVIDDGLVTRDERQLDPLPPRLDVQVAVTDTAGEDRQNERPGSGSGGGRSPTTSGSPKRSSTAASTSRGYFARADEVSTRSSRAMSRA
jgi:hypothetical protein